VRQILGGNHSVIGAMIESNLHAGSQPFPQPLDALRYGVSITETLAEETGQEVAQAAVYLTLRRLEEKGWLEGHEGTTPEQRRGRVKKFYRLTPEGRERLAEARDTLRSMWSAAGEEWAT